MQAKLTKRFSNGLLAADPLHATEPQEQRRRLLLHRPQPQLRRRQLHPHARVRAGGHGGAALRQGRRRSTSARARTASSAAGRSTRTSPCMSGLPFNVSYRDAGADRDTGRAVPTSSATPQTGSGDGLTTPYFNVTPIGTVGQRLRASGQGHLRRPRAQRPARPRLLERGRLAVQALQDRRAQQPGVPHRGPERLQPRQPRQPRRGSRRARQPEHPRRASSAARRPTGTRATSSSRCGSSSDDPAVAGSSRFAKRRATRPASFFA